MVVGMDLGGGTGEGPRVEERSSQAADLERAARNEM